MKENVNDYSKKLRELLVEEINEVIDPSTGLLKEEGSEFVDCPLCGSKKFCEFWVKDGFTYVRCQDCQFVYLNPRLNESATLELYNGAWTNFYNQRKFFQPNVLDKKINCISNKRGKLLEIGCTTGFFYKQQGMNLVSMYLVSN